MLAHCCGSQVLSSGGKKPVFMSNSARLQHECLGLKYFLHHQCLFVLLFHLNRYLFGLRWLRVMVSIREAAWNCLEKINRINFPLLIVSVREMRERFCLSHLRMVQLSVLSFETEKQENHREGWCWGLIKQDDKLLSLMTSNWASFNFPLGGHWSQMWRCPHLQSVFMSVRTCPYYDTGEICALSPRSVSALDFGSTQFELT